MVSETVIKLYTSRVQMEKEAGNTSNLCELQQIKGPRVHLGQSTRTVDIKSISQQQYVCLLDLIVTVKSHFSVREKKHLQSVMRCVSLPTLAST